MEKSFGSRGGFEPPTFRLTADRAANLNALSGVSYKKRGAIFPSLVAPTPAPTRQVRRAYAPQPVHVQPAGPSAFFKREVPISTQPVDKMQNGARFGLDDAFHHPL